MLITKVLIDQWNHIPPIKGLTNEIGFRMLKSLQCLKGHDKHALSLEHQNEYSQATYPGFFSECLCQWPVRLDCDRASVQFWKRTVLFYPWVISCYFHRKEPVLILEVSINGGYPQSSSILGRFSLTKTIQLLGVHPWPCDSAELSRTLWKTRDPASAKGWQLGKVG